MSRHKLVKGLDLEEELDDYDGAEDDTYEEEIAPEDKGDSTLRLPKIDGLWTKLTNRGVSEHLRLGTLEVRSTLGHEFPATDQEIHDSLYYYYYDVQKTVNYLLNQKTKSKAQKRKKTGSGPSNSAGESIGFSLKRRISSLSTAAAPAVYDSTPSPVEILFAKVLPCPAPFCVADFFEDAPWLNIPQHRRGEILIEALHPRRGLLGGSPTGQDAPPRSKLAALAAARKKKENLNTQASGSKETASSAALLEKLGTKLQTTKLDSQSTQSPSDEKKAGSRSSDHLPKKYPKKRQTLGTDPNSQTQEVQKSPLKIEPSIEKPTTIVSAPSARPSTFAQIIFGSSGSAEPASMTLAQSSFSYSAHAQTDTKRDPFAEPSPDDVVMKAQTSKGSKGAKEPNKAARTTSTPTAPIVEGVASIAIAETPKVKSKNLDVVREYEQSEPKNAANFVVIGHVDAGKSTLMGRLLHDLNVVDSRTIEKYRKEAEKIGKSSFALAWVLDQGTEERARGVTIDIATNQFATDQTIFTVLDAPGHRDFIPNMIAGASQADFAILVIDAGTGNFESGLRGQTKEHALLVRSMGVQRIVVAVNKLDTIDWSEDRFNEIFQQISAFLTTAGFLPKNISFVPCSGLTGENIVHLTTDPKAAWYTGPSLIAQLESSEPITRALVKPLRLTIDDIFRGGVQNPLSISGRLDAGTVQLGDSIVVMPANQAASIKALDVNNEPAEWAVAGQNCVLHLADIEAKYLKPGDVVCAPSAPIQCVKEFKVKLLAFEHVMPMHCEIHKGRLHAPGRIVRLVAVLDKGSGAVVKGKKPRLIKPGSVARVVVEVDEAIPLELGGRVILRASGETIGAGLVE